MKTPLVTAGQLLVAIGVSLLLADVALFPARTIPFTHLRASSITDFPLMIVRYFVLFPFFVMIVVHQESWIEASPVHLLKALVLITVAHITLAAGARPHPANKAHSKPLPTKATSSPSVSASATY